MKENSNKTTSASHDEQKKLLKEVAAELSGKTLFPEKVKRVKGYLKIAQFPPSLKSKQADQSPC